MHAVVALLAERDKIPVLVSVLRIEFPWEDVMHMLCGCGLTVSFTQLTCVAVSSQDHIPLMFPMFSVKK